MLTYGQIWLETSTFNNSITISAILRESVSECVPWAFRAHCVNNGGIWTEVANKWPILLEYIRHPERMSMYVGNDAEFMYSLRDVEC